VDTLTVLLQVVLSGVLAVAGIGKLRDLPGSRQAVRDFGVAERLATSLGNFLPFVEIAIAALLLFGATATVAALAAAALFLIFVAAIVVNLRQGRQPDCHCFGQLHSEPAGWTTVIRNVALAAVAIVVAGVGGRGIAGWFTGLSVEGQAGLILGVPILAAMLLQARNSQVLVRQNAQLLDRLEKVTIAVAKTPGPAGELGKLAQAFDLPALDGGRLTLQGLLKHGKPMLLLFMSPTCGPCNALMPDIGEWTRRFTSELTVAIVSTGSVDDNRAKTAAHGIPFIGLQEWPDISKLYGVNATPTGVLIDTNGLIREPNANGRNEIRDLVARTIDDRPAPIPVQSDGPLEYNADGSLAESLFPDPSRSLGVGRPVPRLPLPDLEGHYTGLGDFRGEPFLLVFWNTDCSFCKRMLPDLRDWEAEVGAGSLRLVFASAGTPEAIRDLGLRSTVLLDDELAAISKAFGAPGTPSAVLIDGDSRTASDIMIGADAILDFLDEQTSVVAESGFPQEQTTLTAAT